MTRRDYIYKLKLRDNMRKCLEALVDNPASSASISSGGGSKSYTYQDRSRLQADILALENELAQFRESFTGGTLSVNYARWC